MATEQEIAGLLGDEDRALREWFAAFDAHEDPELILAGGSEPSRRRLGEVFDAWVERSREQLRELICARLGYGGLNAAQRTTAEVVTVGVVASVIAGAALPETVDPVLTAALLVSRQKLDKLCADFEPPAK